MKELIENNYKNSTNITVKVSWDESGTRVENILDLLIVKKLSDGFIIPKSRIHKIKKNGAYKKEDVCIACSEEYGYDFSYSIFLIISTSKLNFFDIEFLRILIEYDDNDEDINNMVYDKKITENQNGSVLHVGNIFNGKFEPIFDYIDSTKVIEKQLKISLKNNLSTILNYD